MKLSTIKLGLAGAFLSTCVLSNPASAHFKLLKPVSWLVEDSTGNPQKVGPCGVAEGDTSADKTGMVTTYTAGEKITVEWVDTIAHPGYFRIAVASKRSDLKEPSVKQGSDCSYDESMTPKGGQGNVLADGIFFRSRNGFGDAAGKMFSQTITLPTEPCDDCTLQVMQVMENDIQSLSNCYYHHCANIKIVAGSGADAPPVSDAGAHSAAPDAQVAHASDSGTTPSTGTRDSSVPPSASSGSPEGTIGAGSTGTGTAKPSTSNDGGTAKHVDAGTSGTDDTVAPESSDSSGGGCAINRSEGDRGAGLFGLLLAFGACMLGRRRRTP